MFCFLQALSSAKAWQKSQQTGNEAAALSFFGLFFLFVFMTDILSASLSKLSPSLLKLLSNPMMLLQGSNPVRCTHLLLKHRWTQGPGRGVNPSRSCTTFLLLRFSQSRFSWKLGFFKQGPKQETWAPWTFRPRWLCSCTWSSVLQLSCHIFGNDLLTGTPAAPGPSHTGTRHLRGYTCRLHGELCQRLAGDHSSQKGQRESRKPLLS